MLLSPASGGRGGVRFPGGRPFESGARGGPPERRFRPIPLTSAIHLRALGSGSSGNAALVTGGGSSLLVEAGFSCRELERRLRRAGCEPGSLDAVLVSHEHGDHARGAFRFAARHDLPLFATDGTWERLLRSAGNGSPDGRALVPRRGRLRAGLPVPVGGFTVVPFAIPHDAGEPVGFRLEAGPEAVVLVTDFGHISPEMEAAIEGASVLLIESNYDERMLYDSRYPFPLRERIASRFGHCSNGALALYLRRRLPRSVRTLLLAHLSENTNTPALALAAAEGALRAAGRPEVEVRVAARRALSDSVSTPLRPAAPPFPPPFSLPGGAPSLFPPGR